MYDVSAGGAVASVWALALVGEASFFEWENLDFRLVRNLDIMGVTVRGIEGGTEAAASYL